MGKPMYRERLTAAASTARAAASTAEGEGTILLGETSAAAELRQEPARRRDMSSLDLPGLARAHAGHGTGPIERNDGGPDADDPAGDRDQPSLWDVAGTTAASEEGRVWDDETGDAIDLLVETEDTELNFCPFRGAIHVPSA